MAFLSRFGVGIGTLVYMAKQSGWRRDTPTQPAPPPRRAPKPQQSNTARYAAELWLAASTDDATVSGHPYTIAKGINWAAGAARCKASGFIIGKEADCIVVPIRNLQTNKIQGVQCIGDKPVNGEWLKQNFGSVSGGALILGNTLDKSLVWYVCEGWASTVSTVFHHLHGNGVCACSFGKAMQRPIANTIAKIHEPQEVIILEEDDS